MGGVHHESRPQAHLVAQREAGAPTDGLLVDEDSTSRAPATVGTGGVVGNRAIPNGRRLGAEALPPKAADMAHAGVQGDEEAHHGQPVPLRRPLELLRAPCQHRPDLALEPLLVGRELLVAIRVVVDGPCLHPALVVRHNLGLSDLGNMRFVQTSLSLKNRTAKI